MNSRRNALSLLTVEEFAKELGVSKVSAARFARHIPHVRFGPRTLRIERAVADKLKGPDELAMLKSRVNKEEQRRSYRRRYGVEVSDRDAILSEQGGVCAICDHSLSKFGSRGTDACLDHCHATGRVRGVLCNHCNKMLGMARDRPVTLRRAAEYLELLDAPIVITEEEAARSKATVDLVRKAREMAKQRERSR